MTTEQLPVKLSSNERVAWPRSLTCTAGIGIGLAGVYSAWAIYTCFAKKESTVEPSLNGGETIFLPQCAVDHIQSLGNYFYQIGYNSSTLWILSLLNCVTEFRQNLPQLNLQTTSLEIKDLQKKPITSKPTELAIKEEVMTLEHAESVVRDNPRMIQSIPKELITLELAKLAIQGDRLRFRVGDIEMFKCIPEEVITKELAESVVRVRPEMLKFVPKKLITKELVESVVRVCSEMLKYVPKELITKDLAELTIKKMPLMIEFSPEKFITPELAELVVKRDAWLFQFIPQEIITPELVQLAMERNTRVFQFVPKELITPELANFAVKKNFLMLKFVPQELITTELAEFAVKQNIETFQFIPKESITPDLAHFAVKKDPWMLKFVPQELITIELGEFALRLNGLTLQFVPEKLMSSQLLEQAILSNGLALEFVPEKYKTITLCRQAVQNKEEANQFVPESMKKDLFEIQTDVELAVQKKPDSVSMTRPLPLFLQDFVDKFLSSPLTDLTSQGFNKIAEGGVKCTWGHPLLPEYVLKIPHAKIFSIEHANAAMASDVSTLLHLQRIVAEASLSHILIPTSYLLVIGDQNIIVQEKIDIMPTTAYSEDFYSQEFSTLIQQADAQLYPQIDNMTKSLHKIHIVKLITRLLNRPNKQYTMWETQLLERSWIWDLAPEQGHNAGLARTKQGDLRLAIIDGAL